MKTLNEFFEAQIQFMADCVDFTMKSVIEYGAQFGNHSARLIMLGAFRSFAVEGRQENIKNIDEYEGRIVPVLADVRDYIPTSHSDIGLILGILYHLDHPALFLRAQLPYIDQVLFIWTHYTHVSNMELDGYKGIQSPDPGDDIHWAIEPMQTFWFRMGELFRCIEDNGFKVHHYDEMRTPVNPQFPAMMIYAERVKK